MRHYEKQQPKNTLFPTNAECSKRTGRISAEHQFTQRVYISPFRQLMIIRQTEPEDQMLVAPRHPIRKRMECSAARGIQYVKRDVPFQKIISNFSGETRLISKNQVVATAKRMSRLMMPTTKTTGEMVEIMKRRENEMAKLPRNSIDFPTVIPGCERKILQQYKEDTCILR